MEMWNQRLLLNQRLFKSIGLFSCDLFHILFLNSLLTRSMHHLNSLYLITYANKRNKINKKYFFKTRYICFILMKATLLFNDLKGERVQVFLISMKLSLSDTVQYSNSCKIMIIMTTFLGRYYSEVHIFLTMALIDCFI